MKELAIIGTTASGKTALSLEIANKTNSIILSLDSLCVYKEIDIASAKPTKIERSDKPKINKKESKQLRAQLVAKKSQDLKPLKAKIEELENKASTLFGLDKTKVENEILEVMQKIESINSEFDKNMSELS